MPINKENIGENTMNKNCDKDYCMYHKTCLIKDQEKINKCTGKLSEKNPMHPNYALQVRRDSK